MDFHNRFDEKSKKQHLSQYQPNQHACKRGGMGFVSSTLDSLVSLYRSTHFSVITTYPLIETFFVPTPGNKTAELSIFVNACVVCKTNIGHVFIGKKLCCDRE